MRFHRISRLIEPFTELYGISRKLFELFNLLMPFLSFKGKSCTPTEATTPTRTNWQSGSPKVVMRRSTSTSTQRTTRAKCTSNTQEMISLCWLKWGSEQEKSESIMHGYFDSISFMRFLVPPNEYEKKVWEEHKCNHKFVLTQIIEWMWKKWIKVCSYFEFDSISILALSCFFFHPQILPVLTVSLSSCAWFECHFKIFDVGFLFSRK